MPDAGPSGSPLEAAAGAAGPRATEAFSALGNETRMSILLALWEAYEPFAEDNEVPFSELRERVGMRDSGQFNYHLDKLTDHFIRSSDDGYELREAGQKIVRAVIAGTGIEDTTLPAAELDVACHRCGGDGVEISYRRETLFLTCPDCDGFITDEEFPSGTLAVWEFEPAGLVRRDTAEILVAGAIIEKNQFRMMMAGICPDCSGAVETSLHICEDHAPGAGAVCPNCGTRDSARVRYICTVCKNWNGGPVQTEIIDHPAVVSFYYDHSVDITYDIDDVEGFGRSWELLWDQDHTLVSTDPVRIRVTVRCDGDERHLLLDDALDVVDVR